MSSFIYDFVTNIQEFCFVVKDILRIPEMISYWTMQVTAIQMYISELLRILEDSDSHDERPLHSVNSLCFRLNDVDMGQSQIPSTPKVIVSETVDVTSCKSPLMRYKSRTSTPLCHSVKSAERSSGSKEKVMNLQYRLFSLELEVESLKKQVEVLSKNGRSCCHQENSHSLSSIPETVELKPSAPPPPPPPPPPPLLFIQRSPMVFKRKRNSKILTENNLHSNNPRLSMAAILKGLKDVKLKPTERSPGGTPIRKMKPLSNNNVTDVLQEALKKRFRDIHPMEISDKENVNDSWEKSHQNFFF